MDTQKKHINVALLGALKSGITTLKSRFCDEQFEFPVKGLGLDVSRTDVLIGDTKHAVMVWQPSIGERLVSLNRNFSQMAQVSLLLFDSTSEASFACTKLLLSAISPPSGSRIIMLVATKIDLDSDRAVTREEASEFARSNGLLYAETSAKTGEGVVEAFKTGISASLANANSEGTKKTNTITLQNHPSPAASNCEC